MVLATCHKMDHRQKYNPQLQKSNTGSTLLHPTDPKSVHKFASCFTMGMSHISITPFSSDLGSHVYIPKRRTLIQVLPPANAYTKLLATCSCIFSYPFVFHSCIYAIRPLCVHHSVRVGCLRAIPFEKLVGGVSGVSFSDHPQRLFTIFLGNAMQKTARQTTPQWFRNYSQTTPRHFFKCAPDTPATNFSNGIALTS